MWAQDGSHIVISSSNGLTGYDSTNKITYTAHNGVFSMRNGYVEEGLTVGGKLKIVPVTSGDNDGVLQLGDNAFLTTQGAYPVGSIYLSVTGTDPATPLS